MARTYRRQRAAHDRASALRDHLIHLTHHPYRVWIEPIRWDPNSPEGRRRLARFHSDKPWRNGPSKAFRRPYHHAERQACRQTIHRWQARPDHECVLPPPHKHSAQWDWF